MSRKTETKEEVLLVVVAIVVEARLRGAVVIRRARSGTADSFFGV